MLNGNVRGLARVELELGVTLLWKCENILKKIL